MTKRRMSGAVLRVATLLAVAAPALAQDVSLACSNAGLSYKAGEFACIAACHQQRRLARCDVAENRANWTYVSESCPTAMINAPWPSAWSEIPAAVAMSPIPVTVNRTEPAPQVAGALHFATFRTLALLGD